MRVFKGKTAFVTGGAAGIGLAMVKAFLREGMNVVAADIREDSLAEAAAELSPAGNAVHLMPLDVTDRAALANAAEQTAQRFAERVVQGIRDNEPYIIATSLFLNDEVREFYDSIVAALPQTEKDWPGRSEYEAARRRMIAEGKTRLATLNMNIRTFDDDD